MKRLQFGVTVAPNIFQKFIETRLSGIDGVFPYFDDILVTGNSPEKFNSRVR